MRGATLISFEAVPLSVPTVDPFVIASGEVHATRSVLVRVEVRRGQHTAMGLGEAACLPPVTREDQPDCLQTLLDAKLADQSLENFEALLDQTFAHSPVARAGAEMAILDALARLDGVPLWRFLGGPMNAVGLETDITLPILSPERMAELASHWWSLGFRKLKVKAGRSLDDDIRRLAAIVKVTPDATFQPDANGGLTVEHALAYLQAARRLGAQVTCFEQPCATVEQMLQLRALTDVPLIADESVKALADLDAVKQLGGVNLKIAKSGGLLAARRIGLAARRLGLKVMVGGMVETRLGMTAATHLAASLGGVDFADLDTAWLLAEERFIGGYLATGPHYALPNSPGLAISYEASSA